MKKFSRKKIIIAAIIIVVAVVGLVAARGNSTEMGECVNTALVETGNVEDYLSAVGRIESNYTKNYTSKRSATIKTVDVEVGDTVEEGQVLLTFDIDDNSKSIRLLELQHENAKLSLESLQNQNKDADAKKAEYKADIADLEKKIKELNSDIADLEAQIEEQNVAQASEGDVPQTEGEGQISDLQQQVIETEEENPLEKQLATLNSEKAAKESQIDSLKTQIENIPYVADTSLKQAQNQIETAQINLDQAKSQEIEDKIVADKAGTITTVNAEEDANTSSFQAAGGLVEVSDLSDLKIVLYIDKYEAVSVSLGDTATIYDGDKQYQGEVSYIAPKADSMTGNLLVEVKVNSENSSLKINFEADVDILLQAANEVLYVPVESVKKNKDGEQFVFVIEEGKAVKKIVEKGLQSDSYVEIKSGLELGEEVILNPSSSIEEGTLVTNESETTQNSGGFFANRPNRPNKPLN